MRRNMRKSLKNSQGQAITEFTVALPVLVMLFLFSQYFYEALHAKLKAQEMGRYVAWEFTGYALHDYKNGKTDAMYSKAESSIIKDAKKRFANLNSTETQGTDNSLLMGKWSIDTVKVDNLHEPPQPSGGLPMNLLSTGVNAVLLADNLIGLISNIDNLIWDAMSIYYLTQATTLFGSDLSTFSPLKEWKFNTNGYVQTKVRLKFENSMIPKKFMGYDLSEIVKPLYFEETVVLLADSWKLQYGKDIHGTKDKGEAFYKQVDRMAFFNSAMRSKLGWVLYVVKYGTDAIALMTLRGFLGMNKLDETTVASLNYQGGEGNSGSGRIAIEEDEGRKVEYDTIPLLSSGTGHTDSSAKANGDNSYYEDMRVQRGDHYMGCSEQESMGCTSSLSQDNPFGDYVIPNPDF